MKRKVNQRKPGSRDRMTLTTDKNNLNNESDGQENKKDEEEKSPN